MKKFFSEEDKEKEKGKIIELSFGMEFDEIKDNFEDVDHNGEEKNEEIKSEETYFIFLFVQNFIFFSSLIY